jgi:hypothetical protein
LVLLYSSILFGSAQQERSEIPSVLCTMSSVLRAHQEAWCNPQAANNVGEALAHFSGGERIDTEDGASRPRGCRSAVAPH